ncbi:uncharacterized protein [Drosophila bipectinata]|uniref:uncharacterized protein n=1 Tax=Drosophila bipectinata TaxID=42026 RepID=UPI001C892586|nr:uncharacterized protein LOC108133047 [Drosophila bipectinata]
MILGRFVRFLVLAGTIYLAKEFGSWDEVGHRVGAERPASDLPVGADGHEEKPTPKDLMAPDSHRLLFDEEDKRRMKRAQEDLGKKLCQPPLCEPKPKPLTEAINDALYDTWLAIKKIPDYWSRAAADVQESVSKFFDGGKK